MFSFLRSYSFLSLLIFSIITICACSTIPETQEILAKPQISEITVEPGKSIKTGESASLTINASGNDLTYLWSVNRGTISSPSMPGAIYTAPDTAGPDTVTITVSNEAGTETKAVGIQIIDEDASKLTTEIPPLIPSDTEYIVTATWTPSTEPTVTNTPEIIQPVDLSQCDLRQKNTTSEEITYCSLPDSEFPCGIRVIARWLTPDQAKGFFIAAHKDMGITHARIIGWKYMPGNPKNLLKPYSGSMCDFGENWNVWWDPESKNPDVDSIITIEYLDAQDNVLVTVKVTVVEDGLILDSINY